MNNQISFSSAVLLSINVMIGAGILYGVGPMTASAGTLSFLAWPLISIILFPIIWTIAKASNLFPGKGGFHHYCSQGLNPVAGFIAHWGYTLGYLGMAASLLAVIRNWLLNNTEIAWIHHFPFLFNFLAASFYIAINLIPLSKISKIQSVATILKIIPLLTVILLITYFYNPQLTIDFNDYGKLGLTFSTVIFAFLGFETCCSIGSLLKDGPQKVSKVIFLGFFITTILYFLFHIGVLYIMGEENLAKEGATAFPSYLGVSPFLKNILQVGIAGVILFCWSNSILGVSIGVINNIHFLGTQSSIVGSKHLTTLNRHERPVNAIIWYGAALFAFTTFITQIDVLFALTNFGAILTFLLTILAVFFNRLEAKNYGHVTITLLAFLSSGVLIYYSWIQIPNILYFLPFVVGIVVGIVLHKLKQRVAAKPLFDQAND